MASGEGAGGVRGECKCRVDRFSARSGGMGTSLSEIFMASLLGRVISRYADAALNVRFLLCSKYRHTRFEQCNARSPRLRFSIASSARCHLPTSTRTSKIPTVLHQVFPQQCLSIRGEYTAITKQILSTYIMHRPTRCRVDNTQAPRLRLINRNHMSIRFLCTKGNLFQPHIIPSPSIALNFFSIIRRRHQWMPSQPHVHVQNSL